MTQEEARTIVKEAMEQFRDKSKAKVKKVCLAEGIILAINIGSVIIANKLGISREAVDTIAGITMGINGISAVVFVNIFAPEFVRYSDNKEGVRKIESEPTPDPEVDYVALVEKYGLGS